MKPRWALSLALTEARSLAALRDVPRAEVCVEAGDVWCRGDLLDEAIEQRLRCVPGAFRYDVIAGEQLTPHGNIVPTGLLPKAPWSPLAEWFRVELPQCATIVRPPLADIEPVQLSFVRSTAVREASFVLTTLPRWQAYGETAAAVRLSQWSFAISSDGRCIIRGTPLPPIAGTQLVEDGGLLVPAGWQWQPTVDARAIRSLLGLQEGDMALFDTTLFDTAANWELIGAGDWVRGTRSAIRLSARRALMEGGLAHGP
jgi:hypothetical protein